MILVELGRADAESSAGELLHTNFKADGLNVALKEKRVKFAISQERHVTAGDVKLDATVRRAEHLRDIDAKRISYRKYISMSRDAISNVRPDA